MRTGGCSERARVSSPKPALANSVTSRRICSMDRSSEGAEGSPNPSSLQGILSLGTVRFGLRWVLLPRQTDVIFILHSFPRTKEWRCPGHSTGAGGKHAVTRSVADVQIRSWDAMGRRRRAQSGSTRAAMTRNAKCKISLATRTVDHPIMLSTIWSNVQALCDAPERLREPTVWC